MTVNQFNSNTWLVSDNVSTELISFDGLVKMKIEIYPNGEDQLQQNYVSLYAQLLSDNKHCYASMLKYNILTPANLLKYTAWTVDYWTKKNTRAGISRYISRQTCQDINEGLLDGGNLNIKVECMCMSTSEEKANRLVSSSRDDFIDITYEWIVCDLPAYLNFSVGVIPGPLFPPNKDATQFFMHLIPVDENEYKADYISMQICLMSQDTKGQVLLLNSTVAVRIFRKNEETQKFGPYLAVYEETRNCWGPKNILSYEKAMLDQCIAFEYYGTYLLSKTF